MLDHPENFLITSHSIDATFESCPRRFEFLHSWLRAPERERDSYAADVGTALHEATQDYVGFMHVYGGHEAALESAYFTLAKHWPWEVEERRIKEKKTLGNRTFGTAILMLEEIVKHVIWDEWELVSIEGFGPAIEVPYRIIHKSLGDIPLKRGHRGYIATQGKMDFILRHRRSGRYKVVDLKTTEKTLPSHDAAFYFSGQGSNYGLVLAHALGIDWEIQGIDVTYLIAHFDTWNQQVYPLNYSYDGEEIQDQINAKIDRLERMVKYARQNYWPRRQHGCDFYGVPCGFLDICKRRDDKFIENWFDFEVASGRFGEYNRIYNPVWTIEA